MQPLKIGTRESELAVWQARQVQAFLKKESVESELVFISSEGDLDLTTPLYEIGVQGIFTKTLDIALLNKRIDIAVHSMKDVPTQLPQGIVQAAVLKRDSYKDLLVFKGELPDVSNKLGIVNGQWPMINRQSSAVSNSPFTIHHSPFTIATSSIRRKAQWFHRYPSHTVENLRGNVNTRLRKLKESNWDAAIFAAAGLERINLRPKNSIELDWMLPAPAQGAIVIVCREDDKDTFNICQAFNDKTTEICTKIERDFLRGLMGGCSTPISALAEVINDKIIFKGNVCSPNGNERIDIIKEEKINDHNEIGISAAKEILMQPVVQSLIYDMQQAKPKIEILSTRPLSIQLTKEAAVHSIHIDEISFIKTEIIKDGNLFNKIENYLHANITAIFTSMNAVDAVAVHATKHPNWKIYSIGNTTKQLIAENFGDHAIAGTAVNADELADIIIKDGIDHAIFFCGNQRRDELPEKLKLHDVTTDEVVVYNTDETPVAINKKYNGILFFSPSAVESFFSINTVDPETQLFAIGSTTAKAIQQYNKNNVVISGLPGKENLVRQVIEYYKSGT